MDAVLRDLRDAYRALRTSPTVSVLAVLSLSLCIGANTAAFSMFDGLALRSLPVRDPGRLALLTEGDGISSWSNPIWEQLRDRPQLFGGSLAWSFQRFDVARGGPKEPVEGIWTSGHFFEVLGVPAVLGRTLREADDRSGGGAEGPVVVISHGFWVRRFGGARDVVGRTLTLDRVPFTIVGVTPPGFAGPEVGRAFDVAVPLGTEPLLRGSESWLGSRGSGWLSVMARLKPGQALEAANAALATVRPQILDATLPTGMSAQYQQEFRSKRFLLEAAAVGGSNLRRTAMGPLAALMTVVALVLLVACANVAHLGLARASARRHELSLRTALGASPLRLARQLLTESLLLSSVGAALGLVFAAWCGDLLVRQFSTAEHTVALDIPFDWRVLCFTAALAVGAAVLFGTVPALRAARAQPIEALKQRGWDVPGGGRLSVHHGAVAAQVAFSVLLVVAAGLFSRTFAALAGRDLGFDRDRVLVVGLDAGPGRIAPAGRAALFERVRESVAVLPGVSSVATSVVAPLSGEVWITGLPGEGSEPDGSRFAFQNMVSPGWFATFGTRLLAGREFDGRDVAGAPAVAIVNREFARRYLRGEDPVGRTVRLSSSSVEVVGLATDAVYASLREPVPPTLYTPIAQSGNPPPAVVLSVRAAQGPPAALARSVASAIGAVDPTLAISFKPLDSLVDASLVNERLLAMLSSFFGGLGLLLAALGLFGVTSYGVSRHRTEIAIRIALGALPVRVLRLVLGRVAVTVGIGIGLGVAASLAGTRLLHSLLFGIEPGDPLTLVAAALALAVVAALAGWLPARRAVRLDPAEVLRGG